MCYKGYDVRGSGTVWLLFTLDTQVKLGIEWEVYTRKENNIFGGRGGVWVEDTGGGKAHCYKWTKLVCKKVPYKLVED